MTFPVPPGWRLLESHEIVMSNHKMNYKDGSGWVKVSWDTGKPASYWPNYIFICEGAPPEKEWLNPWD